MPSAIILVITLFDIMIPSYNQFILQYPAYASAPYNYSMVVAWLDEIYLSFPQIEGCLPEPLHQLASYYGLRYLEALEDCESPMPILSVSSRNDSITYALAGKGQVLMNNTWGNKLNRLFKTYGCFHHVYGAKTCCNHGCGAGCREHSHIQGTLPSTRSTP